MANRRVRRRRVQLEKYILVLRAYVYARRRVRVRLEDNLYMERGVLAPSNAALGEKGVDILRTLGKEPATAQEAREMLGLQKLV